jgi:hypothetical protein
MYNMQSTPIWNTVAGNFQANLDNDHYWKFQGIHFRGTDSNGTIEVDGARSPMFKDCIFEGNAGLDQGIWFSDDVILAFISKCRFYNCVSGIGSSTGNGAFGGEAWDCLLDGNTVSNSRGVEIKGGAHPLFVDCEFKNHAQGDFIFGTGASTAGVPRLRNCILASATEFDGIATAPQSKALVEDHDGEPGDTRQLSMLSSGEAVPIIQSETTKVRSGGSTISIKVTPSTNLGTVWEHSRQLLFELPFFATTNSKTYTVYFASDTTTEWTSDPAAGELWIELEYWGHASNDFRRITKSTGTVDFKTDTDFDQSLAVTIAPAQAGVAYLRCYYAKTKEGGKANIFYGDPIPVVT